MAIQAALPSLLFSTNAVWVLVALGGAYFAHVAFRRLYLSPIAGIPGPRLAALTWWYQFYYDIILGGQYTFKVIELHKEYGPIIRINPDEVHVGDADFFPELFAASGRRRNKWLFHTQQFGAPQSALSTIDHDLHRLRRSALNPFFSAQSVRKLQPVIEERADALLYRFREYVETSDKPLNLVYPFSAFTNDVINEYAFARSNHLVDDPSFGSEVVDSLLQGTHMGQVIKHMNWALTMVDALPESISSRYVPGWGEFLKLKKTIARQIAEIQTTKDTDNWAYDVNHPTIFYEMLSSKILPPREKTTTRLAQDGQILVQGGTLTSSWALVVVVFHLLNKPQCLSCLRDELFEAIPDPDMMIPVAELQKLPYLRGVVKESLRLAHGTSGGLPLVAPDEALIYNDKNSLRTWVIPPGTPVSMSPYQIVMDESIYYDPFGFHPERWIESEEGLDKYLFVIFSGGNRVCLGMALAQVELYVMISKLFRRWGGVGVAGRTEDGDRRPGDIGVMRLHETSVRDCEMAADYFIPIPYKGSKGVRVILEKT